MQDKTSLYAIKPTHSFLRCCNYISDNVIYQIPTRKHLTPPTWQKYLENYFYIFMNIRDTEIVHTERWGVSEVRRVHLQLYNCTMYM